jgi:hypothetical protein
MNEEVIAMLATLVKEHALDPKAALEAAWKQGWKEANATYQQRQYQAQTAAQMQGLQGR